jgi:hypothetical protein
MVNEKKARPESLDFFLAAIAPVFIIGMIGSLVYFIIMVCYEGPFIVRLMWILGLYTVAAVLIARIAIEQSRQLAFAYMFALGGATLFVAPQFLTVTGPLAFLSFPILLGLLVLVAVLADRITFDCTSMNEQVQSTGVGLLQSLGLVQSERKQVEPKTVVKLPSDQAPMDSKRKTSSSKRKHNPGVWVLYFALLALPMFGLGQLAIQNPLDRRWAFTFLFFYLLSSMFLLVLISLLSLRKYLRERGVPMETSFAVRWLAIGMTSVFLVLFVLSLLPLPSHSLLSMDLPFRITSRDDLRANKWGWGREGAKGKGPQQGKPDDVQPQDPQQANQEGAEKGQGEAAGEKKDGKQDGKGPSDGGSQKGDSKRADSKRADSKQADSKQTDSKQTDTNPSGEVKSGGEKQSEPNGEKSEEDSKGQEQKPPQNKDGDQRKDQNDRKENAAKDPEKREPQQQGEKPVAKENDAAKQEKPKEAPEQQEQQQQQGQQQAPSMSIQWNLSAAVQWVMMLIFLILAIVFGMKYRKELYQSFRSFLDWLNALLGRKRNSLIPADSVVEDAVTLADLYPPFNSFANPFASGSGWSREQMVRHMYRAVMSWGYERRIVRRDDETPEEFVRRLARRFPEQQERFSMLGIFYNRIAYARGKIGSSEIKPMAELWSWLSATPV